MSILLFFFIVIIGAIIGHYVHVIILKSQNMIERADRLHARKPVRITRDVYRGANCRIKYYN